VSRPQYNGDLIQLSFLFLRCGGLLTWASCNDLPLNMIGNGNTKKNSKSREVPGIGAWKTVSERATAIIIKQLPNFKVEASRSEKSYDCDGTAESTTRFRAP
jgi:hypothetical protein